ncbi:MAG TPA: hypothetical protein VG328_06130 [Stellaceae bacterium]|jgi:hypothetical protein|nr:hypothetical protein [Stellaceae bacterium]
MGLLSDIQTSLLNGEPIGPTLLKLRFLAARLGSTTLEEWVKYEAEGYPTEAPVPDYRKFNVAYAGNFNGPFGRVASNIPIPPYLIAEHAGEAWLVSHERQSVAAIEDLITVSTKNGTNLGINAANLVMLIGDKVFEDMVCHSVRATVSRSALVEMIGTLRARVLELTLELEKNVPGAAEIAVGQASQPTEPAKAAIVTNITNQIMNGPVGSNVANSGSNVQISVSVRQGDMASMTKALSDGGIPDSDAKKFAALVASESPAGADQPFGAKARAWIGANIGKALDGTWKIGAAVATNLLTEVAKRYYGFN